MTKFLLAFLVAFVIAITSAPFIIKLTKKLKFGQNILHYVESHNSKQGTPTMGGIIFIFATLISSLLLFDKNCNFAIICLAMFVGYAVLGFLDDFIKIKMKRNMGLRPYQKIIGQVSLAIILAVFVYNNPLVEGIYLPFSTILWRMSWFIIPYTIFVIIATSNAVNLTDGLDGLAGGVSLVFFMCFGVLIYLLQGSVSTVYAGQLGNIVLLCGAVGGGLLGYLCFNGYPAKIFMGDTGSLALGALVGTVGIFSSLSLYILIVGLMFVLSAVSVVIQVLYYKRTHKRVFLMAPLHHHFEKKGCNECKIVTIYIIITIVLSVFCIWLNMFLGG